MKLRSWQSAALAAALAGACTSTSGGADTASAQAAPTQQAPAQPASYTDEQLRAYVAAKREIEPIQANYATLSEEQRAQATAQIRAIQERHGLTAVTYDRIATRARTDATLAGRITALEVGSFSDAQIAAFARASLEIDPLNRALAAASEAERPQLAAQIRAVLDRYQLEGATYNAIAAQAQRDPALAQRIAASQQAQLQQQQPQQPPPG